MAIVIKEIHVQAVIEKKVVQLADVSVRVVDKIKQEIIQELLEQQEQDSGRKKNER